MTNRERFHRCMEFKEADQIPMIEFASYWDETLERWKKEGLDAARCDDTLLREDFGLDDYRQFWIKPYSESCPTPTRHGAPIILDASDYARIRKDLYPMEAWDEKALAEAAALQDAGDSVIWITLEGFFWFPRYLLGIENHLYAFYDNAELIHGINDELADCHCRIIEKIGRTCAPDFMTFAEDLSYNRGPMIGRPLFDEFLLPYYKRVVPLLKNLGTLSFIDTDGAVKDIIPWFEAAGADGCLPVECNAGSDPVELRRLYPRWRMIGGVEKRALYSDQLDLEEELRRKFELARQGGYIPSVDHQTPPEVSLDQYRRYVKLMRKYSVGGTST